MKAASRLADGLDCANEFLGRTAAWLTLALVLVQFVVVGMRYIFGIGSIVMQESVIYLHGVAFMTAAAYTLKHDDHVRIDIFRNDMTERRKAAVDLAGHLLLLLPFCAVVLFFSQNYVALSWAVLEGSRETSGIHGIYLLKSVILLFAVQMAAQSVSGVIRILTAEK